MAHWKVSLCTLIFSRLWKAISKENYISNLYVGSQNNYISYETLLKMPVISSTIIYKFEQLNGWQN